MGTDLRNLFTPPPASATRDTRHLVFVGRLVEKKGVRYLLDALASLADAYPDLRLTIAGDGPLRRELERRAVDLGIAERVAFLGGVAQASLPELYRRATLAVFPFVVAADGDQEGFGLVIIEAMGCGCPVIANDLAAVHQSIDAGVTGVLAPPGDVAALAAAIAGSLRARRSAQRAPTPHSGALERTSMAVDRRALSTPHRDSGGADRVAAHITATSIQMIRLGPSREAASP
jgi:glycosyltransferase involved in cell wall biosynthesis